MDRLSRKIPTKGLTIAATEAIQRFDALIHAYNRLPGVEGDILAIDAVYGIVSDADHWVKARGVGSLVLMAEVLRIIDTETQ